MGILQLVNWAQQHSVLLMLAIFLVIFATTYWPGRKERVERNGLIPFKDDR
jgi:cbb3-type cytochrome oxidase subunit 3